ncbi:MAG TPA: hypothetical protein VGL61_26165 [Kofleriaceae bacterium]
MRFAIVLVACARIAYADPDHDADVAFRQAEARALAGDPTAIDALEELGRARPITRWTDDAWFEAGKLAEQAGDLPRARADLEQARTVSTDPLLARRVAAALVRLAPLVSWTDVDAAHESLVDAISHPRGDPKLPLEELGALVLASPGYPRALSAVLALARGWERDGAIETARSWLDRAPALAKTPDEREHVTAERARFELRGGDVSVARASIARLADPHLRDQLADDLARAEWRARLRLASWIVLAAIGLLAIAVLVRARVSWRVLVRPPIEVLYGAPIALVLVGVAATGNPLVSRAVRVIAIAGLAVAWLAAAFGRPRSAGRAAIIAVLAALAVLAATYLACDHDRMIDIVIETWRSGPAAR